MRLQDYITENKQSQQKRDKAFTMFTKWGAKLEGDGEPWSEYYIEFKSSAGDLYRIESKKNSILVKDKNSFGNWQVISSRIAKDIKISSRSISIDKFIFSLSNKGIMVKMA